LKKSLSTTPSPLDRFTNRSFSEGLGWGEVEQRNRRSKNRGLREEKRIGEGKIENGGLRNEKCQRPKTFESFVM
jgi:hypothetical protein